MKIINENEKSYIEVCTLCKSILEFTEDDFTTGQYGCVCVTCPKCGETVYVEHIIKNGEKFEKYITKDNISFPQDFYDNSNSTNVSNEEIEEYIKTSIEHIEKTDDCYYEFSIGNMCVFISSYGFLTEEGFKKGYKIKVSKNYYDTFVNKEKEC